MILKIFKAVWFLSLIALLGSFMFVYASIPEQLVIHEGGGLRTISREALFYSSIALFGVCNVLVFVISALYRQSTEEFVCWFYGLIITLNLFFIIAFNFIHVYNSSEKFRYETIGYVIYGSVGLIILWTASWPVYSLVYKKMNKPVI